MIVNVDSDTDRRNPPVVYVIIFHAVQQQEPQPGTHLNSFAVDLHAYLLSCAFPDCLTDSADWQITSGICWKRHQLFLQQLAAGASLRHVCYFTLVLARHRQVCDDPERLQTTHACSCCSCSQQLSASKAVSSTTDTDVPSNKSC